MIVELKARSLDSFSEMIRHEGEEYTYVIEGAVELHTDVYAPLRLEAGDSVFFDSAMGHAYLAAPRPPDATVVRRGDRLRLVFSRTTDLQGDMRPMKGNVFAVRWDDRTLRADALVKFSTDFHGVVSGMTMAPLSPTTDFSFDFRDLDFVRVATPVSQRHAASADNPNLREILPKGG